MYGFPSCAHSSMAVAHRVLRPHRRHVGERNDERPAVIALLCHHAGRSARTKSPHRYSHGSHQKVDPGFESFLSLNWCRILRRREDLRVIVSSATLDAEDFKE